MLAAGSQPVMVEWSVGVAGAEPGQGLLGDIEPRWRELAVLQDVAVFTTHSSHITGNIYNAGSYNLYCKHN